MSTKTIRRMIVVFAVLLVITLAVLSLPVNASAAPKWDTRSNSCLTCHEDLYYLHDTGKYYCITEHKDRCVNCHEGNATVMNKDQAHVGLTAHPQENEGAKCQECHAGETQIRLDTFAVLGGYSTVVKADAYVPSTTVEGGFPDTPEENPIAKTWPFWVGGILIFGLWLALVLTSPVKP